MHTGKKAHGIPFDQAWAVIPNQQSHHGGSAQNFQKNHRTLTAEMLDIRFRQAAIKQIGI